MNCIYLKQKINRTLECKKQNKIINIKECNKCNLKEYKTQKREKMRLKEKCTEFLKNSAKHTLKNNELRKKSAKLAKLERNRYSVFTDDLDHCIICKRKKEHLHEIFFGANRQKSMQYGFVIPLCTEHHAEMHQNYEWQEYWHIKGQEYWERSVGTREEFIKIFGKNYINNE